MAYDPSVPNESNLVRGASGDLEAMQENFSLLSGAAVKGISGLIGVNANTPATGQALRFDGTEWVPSGASDTLNDLTDVNAPAPNAADVLAFDGSEWIPSGLVIAQALADLTDVDDALSPVSGQSLVFDGSEWVASGLISPSAKGILSLSGAGHAIVAVSGDEAIPLSVVAVSGAGFEFNTTSGQIRVVGSGITCVNILAQIGLASGGIVPATNSLVAKIFKNGSGLENVSGFRVRAENTMAAMPVSGGTVWPVQVTALNVPCVSGDLFTLVGYTNTATTTTVVSGQATFLLVEDARKGGGGGGASSFTDPVDVWFPEIPPRTAHAMNDEFNALSGNGGGPGGLDSRWTEWDTAGLNTISLLSGVHQAQFALTQGSFWSGIVQPISGVGATVSGTNWEAYCRMDANFNRATASDDFSFGFALFDGVIAAPTTANFVAVLARMTGSGTQVNFEVGEFNDRSDIPPATSGSVVHVVSGLPESGFWFRIRHQGGTNRFDGDVSVDGRSWRQLGTRTLSWAPVEIGMIAVDVLEGAAGTRARCSRFRMVSGLSARADIIPAGRIRMERVGDNTTDSF